MKLFSVTIQLNAIVQYFSLVLFITLCQVVVPFQPVDEILKYYYPIE